MKMQTPQRITRPFTGFDSSTVAARATLSPTVVRAYHRPDVAADAALVEKTARVLRESGARIKTLATMPKCPLCGLALGTEVVGLDGRFEWLRGSDHYVVEHGLWPPPLTRLVVYVTGEIPAVFR